MYFASGVDVTIQLHLSNVHTYGEIGRCYPYVLKLCETIVAKR